MANELSGRTQVKQQPESLLWSHVPLASETVVGYGGPYVATILGGSDRSIASLHMSGGLVSCGSAGRSPPHHNLSRALLSLFIVTAVRVGGEGVAIALLLVSWQEMECPQGALGIG